MKILITGSHGRLGRELVEAFRNDEWEICAPAHKELGNYDFLRCKAYLEEEHPDIIIHAGALTGVDTCAQKKQEAWESNVNGTMNLIKACRKAILFKNGVRSQPFLIYISTVCVFPGEGEVPDEDSLPEPKNFYALTKLLGEQHVRQYEKGVVIRTNFNAREEWPYPAAFVDRFSNYLFADDLAIALLDVAKNLFKGKIHAQIIHVCGEETLSMYDFAKLTTPGVQKVTLEEHYAKNPNSPRLTVNMGLKTKYWKTYKLTR